MKKNLRSFAAFVLTLSMVFSLFLPTYADDVDDSSASAYSERVAAFQLCPSCGTVDTYVYVGMVSTDIGDLIYYEAVYQCSACGFTEYVYHHCVYR